MRASVVAGASSGGASGGIHSTYDYMTSPGPHTLQGGVKAAGVGTISGATVGAAVGSAAPEIERVAGDAARYGGQTILRSRTSNPDAGTMALGRMMDERVIPYAESQGYGYYRALPGWVYKSGKNSSELLETIIIMCGSMSSGSPTRKG